MKRTINRYTRLATSTVLACLCLLSTGCNDWLELVPPDGLVRDEYWKSKEDVHATLMGAYQQLARLDEKLFMYGELRGDLIVRDENTPQNERNIMEGNIFPNNSLCKWMQFYQVINYCNNVLKYAPIVFESDPTFSEYQRSGYEAEALFLRSLSYFYLVRTFREVPLILEASESDAVDFYKPVSPADEVLGAIRSDLLQARLQVTGDYGSLEKNKGRVSRAAILSLLADIALWNFEYQECIEYVEEVEEMGFELIPALRWFEIFYPGNSAEGIFELQFDATRDQHNSLYEKTYFQRNYLASLTAVELLDKSISRELYRGDGSINPSTLKIWKYAGASGDGGRTLRSGIEASSGNWVVYRMADLLLMKAEALSQSERYEDALQVLNHIRESRGMEGLEVSASPEAFEDVILEERARELAFEGKRWFDLLRMGRRNDYQRKNKLIEIVIEKVPSNQKLVLAAKLTNPWGWYLPIEDKEIERNNKLKQNPYYAGYGTQ